MSALKKLLIVDDSSDNRLLLRDWLEDDYDLAEAEDGMSALKLLESYVYDGILLDMSMPGMSGTELSQKIRSSNKNYAGIPIIAVTAHSHLEMEKKALDSGCDSFIQKPFRIQHLLGEIEKLVK